MENVAEEATDDEEKCVEIASSQKEASKEVFETSKNIENEVEIHLETSSGNLEAEQGNIGLRLIDVLYVKVALNLHSRQSPVSRSDWFQSQ